MTEFIRQRDPRVWVAQLCVVAAVVCAGYVPYSLFMAERVGARDTQIEQQRLQAAWDVPPLKPATDKAPAGAVPEPAPATTQAPADDEIRGVARLTVPKFGDEWNYIAVDGVGLDDIRFGPGHDPRTEYPGEVGNAVFAAHRDGFGSPFNELPTLSVCDAVVVETREARYTYRVVPDVGDGRAAAAQSCFDEATAATLTEGAYAQVPGVHIVSPTDVSVLEPVPTSTAQATIPLITLYTCHPEHSNAQRLVVHAALAETERRTTP